MAKKRTLQQWSVEDSAELYGIRNWGAGYFDVSPRGEVVIRPFGGEGGPEVSVLEIIHEIKERGYDMPVLLRIENILDSQISLLHQTFRAAAFVTCSPAKIKRTSSATRPANPCIGRIEARTSANRSPNERNLLGIRMGNLSA